MTSLKEEFGQTEDLKSLSNREVYGFFSKDTLLGYIVWLKVVDVADILNLFVFPEQRKSGKATALLLETIETLKQAGIKTFYLEVKKSNQQAISVYEKVGFKVVREIKNYYENEDGLAYMYGEMIWKFYQLNRVVTKPALRL